MKIAIDLNDVVRDYSNNFLRYYLDYYNHEYKLDDFEFFTDDYSILFPFKTQKAYEVFRYTDFAFELCGKCPTSEKNTSVELKKFMSELLPDVTEDFEIAFVSTMEYDKSIESTYFFISKLGCDVRKVLMPKDSLKLWDEFDYIITANPTLLNNKPEGRKSIKIETDYNKECESDYKYSRLSKLITDNNEIEKVFK